MVDLTKRIHNISDGYRFRYGLLELLKPSNWLEQRKYRIQRLQRGWADRDTWGGGEYILGVTSGILRKLDDEKNPIDWDQYFETNFQKINGYKNLTEVADDIDQFLAFIETDWADSLGFELPPGHVDDDGFWRSGTTPQQDKKIRAAIKKHSVAGKKSAAKATKAMKFVADNHLSLWW